MHFSTYLPFFFQILAIIGIVVILTVRVQFKTIVLDWLDRDTVKIIVVINFCMTILISILLITGAIKRNMYLMLPWVLLAIMLAISLLVSILYTSIQLYSHEQPIGGTIWLVLGLLAVALFIYMWLVVYSFFSIIREESGRGSYMKDPFRRHY
ncbi:hypothetical protein BDFB_003764 [Asbolus verrucosus]|uniref:Uncharacterized protein n=1 Tax=Asbolus verrucosus TaxID=1661398 RepID=A0A482W365_ASBVE|nr:hypothetical protein BDFB_003764 [Asbolus verrucosus]